jgi:hypothetical protein
LEPNLLHRWEVVLDRYHDPRDFWFKDAIHSELDADLMFHIMFSVGLYRIFYDKTGDVVGIRFDMTNSNENDSMLEEWDDQFKQGGNTGYGATIEVFKNRVSLGNVIACIPGQTFFPVVEIAKGTKCNYQNLGFNKS